MTLLGAWVCRLWLEHHATEPWLYRLGYLCARAVELVVVCRCLGCDLVRLSHMLILLLTYIGGRHDRKTDYGCHYQPWAGERSLV